MPDGVSSAARRTLVSATGADHDRLVQLDVLHQALVGTIGRYEVAHAREHEGDKLALREFKEANNQRLAAMNEIRLALSDLSAEMARRDYTDTQIANLDARIDREIQTLSERNDRLAKELNAQGLTLGNLRSQLVLVGAIVGIGVPIISIVINVVLRFIS
jgi:hypothetical protein